MTNGTWECSRSHVPIGYDGIVTPEPPGTARGWDSETRAAFFMGVAWLARVTSGTFGIYSLADPCSSHLRRYDLPMANQLTPEQEYEKVYEGIVAVAVRCDGAQSKDFVGFDGTDTHYGRRVASVPFAQWTPEVREECARISNKYQKQILAHTGIDVTTLQVVRDALGKGTIYKARNDARRYEKLAAALKDRKIDAVGDKLGIFYGKKDPDFKPLLAACQALPGRKFDWDRKCNTVPVSDAVEAFVQEWDFPITDAARALLEAPQAPAPIEYQITLEDSGRRVFIKTNLTAPGQAAAEAVKQLPGRSFDRTRYGNTADASPAVVAFAATYGLNITPEAKAKCEAAQAALRATDASKLDASDWATVAAHVSSLGSPEELPAVFVNRIEELLRNV